MGKFKDLTGKKFGLLTVIGLYEKKRVKNGTVAIWECLCDCGRTVYRSTSCLNSKGVHSCGEHGKLNIYDVSGTFGIGYTVNKNSPFYFDLEDYDKIKFYCWSLNSDGYIVNVKNCLCLHRLITECPEDLYVDHIGGDVTKHDNRKYNLRITTNSQNLMNRGLQKNNTSGYAGVSWNKARSKWEAHIKVKGKKINLGLYCDIEDAVTARKEAEEKYFGDYSYSNSQKIYKQAGA